MSQCPGEGRGDWGKRHTVGGPIQQLKEDFLLQNKGSLHKLKYSQVCRSVCVCLFVSICPSIPARVMGQLADEDQA